MGIEPFAEQGRRRPVQRDGVPIDAAGITDGFRQLGNCIVDLANVPRLASVAVAVSHGAPIGERHDDRP